MATAAATVTPVRTGDLHISKPTWWLESRFHFSFADWYDPNRSNFGALRVVNDDLVKPRAGFGTHPHRNAEIFSYVVEGELSHQDSMANCESLPRGCLQYMSAGTGVRHSEMNNGSETCRFIQVWLTPDKTNTQPLYGSTTYTKEDRHNKLLHMLGGSGRVPSWPNMNSTQSIQLHQDANVFVSECDPGHSFDLQLGARRQAYLLCIEGDMSVNSTSLATREAAKILGASDADSSLRLQAGSGGAHFLLIEMAMSVL